jgi:hypothetical protein
MPQVLRGFQEALEDPRPDPGDGAEGSDERRPFRDERGDDAARALLEPELLPQLAGIHRFRV